MRLNQNAKVQEGDSPAEEPEALLREMDGVLLRLEELIARINLTNSRTVSEGESLTEKLAKRDCLGKRITLMRSFLDAASARVDRYSRTEIKVHSSVSVSALQQELDRLSKSLRELDEHIQELNWTTEILADHERRMIGGGPAGRA